MRTMKIEMGEKVQTANVFESMWEYLEHYGASVEDFVLSPEPDQGEKMIGSFRPIDDTNFSTFSSDMAEIDGEYYQHVN